MKKITGINNDEVLKELIDVINSNQSNNNDSSYRTFSEKHPEVDLQRVLSNFKQSEYSNYDFEANGSSLEYRTVDSIFHDIYKCIIYLGIIGIVSFVSSFVFYALLSISSSRQITKIRSLVFNSVMHQEIAWHEKTNSGELSSSIISDSLLIEEGIGPKIGILLQNLFTFVFCIAIAFITGWKLTLYLSISLPVILIIIVVLGNVIAKCTKKSQESNAIASGIAQEAFSQIRTIVSFGNEQKEIDRYVNKLKSTRKYSILNGSTFGICLGLIFGFAYASYGIAFVKGSQYINNGSMTGGEVIKVFMGIVMGILSFSGCGNVMNYFGQAVGAASKLFHIIERQPKINNENGRCPKQLLHGDVEFRNVHFSYPARPDIEVLKGISFKCQPGQTIALVGASGSGKSTIIQLLERYYLKSEGDIFIDGEPIEDYDIHWLRTQIGIVSQEPNLFDTTIAENISIGCQNATQEQIEEAAKLAYAHDFITKLPNGYQTNIGERGLQLSGGQKQRICIARALMKNPKILLLDEATSALDNKSEKIVQDALVSASSGRTTIVIAHRLTTVKDCDCIIVMNKGVIVESGTHDELMGKQNVYYNLVKNQKMNVDDNEISDNEEFNDSSSHAVKKSIDEIEDNIESDLSRVLSVVSNKSCEHNTNAVTHFKSKKSNDNALSKKSITGHMNWKRYLEYSKPLWWAILLACIGSVINGIIQPAFAFILSSAMGMFNERGDQLLKDGKFWGLMFVLLGVVNVFSYSFQIGGSTISSFYLTFTLRKEMYNSMIRQEVGFFDCNDIGSDHQSSNKPDESTSNTGTLTAKLSTETLLAHGLNTNLCCFIEIIITIIAGFGIAFCNSWKMTFVLLIITPFLFVGTFIEMNSSKDKTKERLKALEKSSQIAIEAITSIKTVYALNLEDHFCKLYTEKLKEPEKRLERKHYVSGVAIGFSNCITYIAYLVGFLAGSILIKNGKGDVGFTNIIRALMAIVFTAMSIGRTSSIAPDFTKAVDAFGRVLEIIDRQSKIDASDPKGVKNVPFKGSISFNNLRFCYPSRPDVTVLRLGNEKIEVPEGKNLALVGGSGCGKSTLIGLLLRWYDTQHGDVKVDDRRNTDYNIKWLRERIGIVNQEPSLFNISIKDNIRYSKEDATDEEIYEAAKMANIHDFIMSLPEGYDTLIGGMGTSQMSGGQKQRIAIARAMIRNPKILLLDEATSALDAESELIVQQALEKASQSRTTITIAHRLSTIKNADIIVVMREGRIIEMGNHEELMNKKGEYYEMVLAGDGGAYNN
ncbi:MAG: ATP-binding cassette domain-containing protein [Methanosphaera stadtmanae]|nr:ATP-binding cassette domain-containing protein [Methanosphaera stadtmanae]